MFVAVMMLDVEEVHRADTFAPVDHRDIDDGFKSHTFDQCLVEKGPTDAGLVMSKVGFARFQDMITPRGRPHKLATCNRIFFRATGIDPRDLFTVDIKQGEESVTNERLRYVLELDE